MYVLWYLQRIYRNAQTPEYSAIAEDMDIISMFSGHT